MSDEQAAMDRVGRYWDSVARGNEAPDSALDPALVRTIHRVQGLAATPSAETRERVWQTVLANAEAAHRQEEGSTPRVLVPNGRALDAPDFGAPADAPSGRQRWFMAQLATAALLLLTLIGSYMIFGPGRVSRQERPPVFIPAIESTPATPTPEVEKPVAEFLWQSAGDPDLPLADPTNLAIDPQGNIWVTDGRNSRFQIFAPDGTFIEAWGTPGEGEGELDFVEPMLFGGFGAGSMAFDASGNLYVVDPGNYRVQVFGPDRGFITAWGSEGLGDGQFLAALDLAIDRQGQVYVADEMRGDVQLFDRDGRFLSVWSDGAEDWLGKPSGITIDGAGTIWVSHFQRDAIQHYAPDGSLLASWDESGSEAGQFNSPSGVSVDDQGRVFVNEWANNRIQVFDANGTFLATWGGLGRGDAEFSFSGLNGSVLDGEGNIYVVQDGKDLIKKFRLLPPFGPGEAPAAATPEAAEAPIAEFMWASEGSPDLPLEDPFFLTLSPDGNLWVPDGFNSQFQIFSPEGEFLEIWGEPGSGDGQFNFLSGPYGVGAAAFDAEGNLYVADHGNARIQKFGPDRAFLIGWDGSESVEGRLLAPFDIAIGNDGNVYVSDRDDDYVKVFSGDGRYLYRWGGLGASDGKFMEIIGLGIDPSGNVWVVDAGGHRIQKFASDGAFLTSVGAYGMGEGEFRDPNDVAVDTQGRVYVTDWENYRVQVFDGDGQFLGAWGEQGEGEGQFQGPAGIVLDAIGNAYVSDDASDTVVKFRLLLPFTADAAQASATPAAADGTGAEVVWETQGGPDLPLDDPYKIGIDPAGNLWIPDGRNHRFQIFSPEGEFLETWGTAGSSEGEFDFVLGGVGYGAVIWDEDGAFYVVDAGNHRIQKFASDRSFIAAWGNEGVGESQFMGLNDLALDQEGRLFAIDGGRDDIQVFDRDGRFLDAWGGSGTGEGQFTAPSGIAIDGAGNLYVSEYEGHRIQKLSPDGTPLAVWGSYGTDAGSLMNPEDVILDAQGRVFVTEWSNHRVQVFDADGRFLASWGSAAGIGDGPFANPSGAALDGKGFIYVSDGGSDTVLKFRLLPPLAPE